MANSSHKQVGGVRLQRQGRRRSSQRASNRAKADPGREDRITMEVVVDAYDASERANGWFGYLENELGFPFTARCIDRRAISPLQVGDEVEVVSMAPADESTDVAIADWHYWVEQGYQF